MQDNMRESTLDSTEVGDVIELDDELYVVTCVAPFQMAAIEFFNKNDLLNGNIE